MVGVAIGVGFGAADGRAEPAAAIDDSAFATAGWAGAAFRDPSSGLFAFCRQGRAFDDGTVLTFSLDAIGHLDVGLVGGPWTADPDGPDGPLPAAARLDEMTPEGHRAIIHVTLTDDHPWAQAMVVIEARPVTP